MIGFYNYTVILTYMAVMSAVLGITQIMEGNLPMAIILLMISGGCDMFDGKVARTKKDRTDREKIFGIQIDSLSGGIATSGEKEYIDLTEFTWEKMRKEDIYLDVSSILR